MPTYATAPIARLGLQIPNFTYGGVADADLVTDIFDRHRPDGAEVESGVAAGAFTT